VILGATTTIAVGRYLVVVLVLCGLTEVAIRSQRGPTGGPASVLLPAIAGHGLAIGGLGALVWVALKVGALSYGGGFVIIPLMQHDVVTTYQWMTGGQFLNAVALGQVTPGPLVQTVAVVGYAARGVGGGLLAATVAFAPSFLFVLFGAPRFDAIAWSAVALGLTFQHLWQIPVLGGALFWLLAVRRGVVGGIVLAGLAGVALWSIGVPT
jgi:chromate transporter